MIEILLPLFWSATLSSPRTSSKELLLMRLVCLLASICEVLPAGITDILWSKVNGPRACCLALETSLFLFSTPSLLCSVSSSKVRLNHCRNSKLSWYLHFTIRLMSMLRWTPSLRKLCCSNLKLLMNSYSDLARQWTLDSGTFPGHATSSSSQ